MSGYIVRRFAPADAPAVTRLVEGVYGETYYPRELYHPDKISHLNESGRLISSLALDATGQVVGHYALERPHLGAIAEASDAIVMLEHRHHHLMEEMRLVLREEATRLGLTGLVGYPVTNHVFSQRADEHFGALPCGVALGLWPRSFHNMPEPLPQRMSFVICFKYLRPPQSVSHVTTRHAEVCARICQQYGISVQSALSAPAHGIGEILVEHEPQVETGTIRVLRVGADTVPAIRQARARLCIEYGARTLTLELPLSQPGTDEVCRALEADGFFFSGLGPAFGVDGDVLILQLLTEDIDLSLLQIDDPFARDLLNYIARERSKVGEREA